MKTAQRILLLIILLSSLLFAYFVYRIFAIQNIYVEADSLYENIVDSYTIENNMDSTQHEESVKVIDFNALKEINEDVIAWLELPDSAINYPVVQGADNEYYLEHLFNKEVNHSGAVFMDYRSNSQFKDKFTPIYAHHTNNGSMFYDLERYKDQAYYDTHTMLNLYTETDRYHLYPIAGRVMDGSTAFIQLEFYDNEEYENYINDLISISTFKSHSYFDINDQIILLSTCTDDYYNSRYVLICKVVKL